MNVRCRFEQKVVVITGAKSGIGWAAAQLFAKERATLVIADLREAEREAACLRQLGAEAASLKVDVSCSADVNTLIQRTLSTYGRIDILVNNAATGPFKKLEETTVEEWDRIMAVNLRGFFLCSKAVIPTMRRQGGGAIINIGSALALVAAPGVAAYCASKGGVAQLTKAMAIELAEDEIRVNCACPGPIWTPMMREFIEDSSQPDEVKKAMVGGTILKRFGQPHELAPVIAFLASEESSNMTGSIVVADGGWTAQ